MLRKFTIQSVQRKESIAKLYSFGGTLEKRKEFFYTLVGDDEKIYFYHRWITPQRLTKGQTIRCWAKQRTFGEEEVKEFDIAYHSLYKCSIFSDYLFEKAVKDYIQRTQRQKEWNEREIERLKGLI